MKNRHPSSALLLLSAVALTLPLGVVTAPAATATVTQGCAVESGSLTWGVKESFRSYISGSIAKGSWEATDGAAYATPSFTFTGASGELDPATGAGTISFPGAIHFTGHGGVLDMTLAAPQIEIAPDGTALLHLDVRSTDTSGAPSVDEKQAEVGELQAPIAVDTTAGTAVVEAAPVVLTDAGAPAFGGFYEAGEALDPVTMDVQLACESAEQAPVEPSASEATGGASAETPAATEPPVWVPITIGAGVVVALAAATGGFLLARRRRRG
ncbi:HtaA domain-containing protein [Microbacterium sp. NPDC058342]|uniref:HtaA domain-containing protein n=1 Tax=Microbacterium sp. NPDC058342 TaxID=3346454 RepID=UPI00365A5F27